MDNSQRISVQSTYSVSQEERRYVSEKISKASLPDHHPKVIHMLNWIERLFWRRKKHNRKRQQPKMAETTHLGKGDII